MDTILGCLAFSAIIVGQIAAVVAVHGQKDGAGTTLIPPRRRPSCSLCPGMRVLT